MKKILLFTTCLLFGIMATSCSKDETPGFGSIYGIVTDADNNEPIRGASVILSPGNISTTTSNSGHYEFTDLEPGSYKIQVQATNYKSVSRQIQISAGVRSSGDITMIPEDKISGIQLSSTVLNFDTNYSELTLTLRNTGNTGTVSWYISGINVSWLTVSPLQGTTAMGKSSEIKVSINRSKITSTTSTTFIVNSAGGSQAVTVRVSKQSSGSDTPGGGTTTEDYSSATITSCDYRVAAKIVSCKRSGTSVVFTYTLTNNGLGNVNDWRIYPPSSMSLISGGTRSVITDNTGKEYPYPTMTFRNSSTTGSNMINTSFPENIACQGTVTIKDVPSSATKITALIGVYAYPNTTYNMTDSKVTFSNVPIY